MLNLDTLTWLVYTPSKPNLWSTSKGKKVHTLPVFRRNPDFKDLSDDSLLREFSTTRAPTVKEELVARNGSLAVSLARGLSPARHLEDAVQVGLVGLSKAIDRFDPQKGFLFSTFAVPTVRGEILRYFRDRGWMLKTPRHARDLWKRIERELPKLIQRLGRKPTIPEIAILLKISEERIIEAVEVGQAYNPLSLDAEFTSDKEGTDRSYSDVVADPECTYDRIDNRVAIRQALEKLESRQRQVIQLRFFEEMSQTQVARKLGISQMHVSRLEKQALSYLRGRLGQA